MFRYFNALTQWRRPAMDFAPAMIEMAQPPVQSGLMSSEEVAAGTGWRAAGEVLPGDKVLTFDSGLQSVTKVVRQPLWPADEPCPKSFWPLEVPRGALGNRQVMQLLPNQTIMVESDLAEDIYGDPFSLIPASALDGVCGIDRVPPKEGAEVVHLHFAAEEVVFGKNGTLFLCPSSRDIIGRVFDKAEDPMYSILPMNEARFLASRLDGTTAKVAMSTPQQILAAALA